MVETEKRFFIEQKDGHIYEFNNYKEIEPVPIIYVKIQTEKGKRFKEIRINVDTVKNTNVEEIKKWMK